MVVAASILAFAVPNVEVPAQAGTSISPTDLAETADIMGPTLSPDGKRVVFRVARPSVAENETQIDWYVADVAGASPIHAGSAGLARHDGAGSLAEQVPMWDKDSRGFRFLALDGEGVAIWHWRDGDLRREISDAADIIAFTPSRDGKTLRYTIGATRAEVTAAEREAYDDGVLVDDSVDLGQAVAGGKIEGGRRIVQRWNRNWFDRARILWDAPQREIEVALTHDMATSSDTNVRAVQGGEIAFPDGGKAKIVAGADSKRIVVTNANGTAVECMAPVCRSAKLVAIARLPGSKTLVLFESEYGSRERVWLWRVGDASARYVATTDGAERTPIWQPRCAIAATALICAESSAVEPPRLVRIAWPDGKRTLVADPNASLRSMINVVATPMRWDNGHDGILLRPANATGPLPLVIQYYRCAGFLKGGVGDEIPILPLVDHHISVLCINGRQPPAGSPMEASYDLALSAIDEAVDGLVAKKLVDPARVGIGGLSFGSSVALWAIRKSRRFAAATIASGQVGPHYYWSNAVPDRGFAKTFQQFWRAGDPDGDPLRWRVISPMWDVASIDTPLLMQLPESEVRNLVEFNTKLRLAGKPAEMFAFADEIHIKYQPVHKRAVYERNLDWFRFWLKGEQDLAPGKQPQYSRWQNLRAGQSLQAPAP